MGAALKKRQMLMQMVQLKPRETGEFEKHRMEPAEIIKFPLCEKFERQGKWAVCGSGGLPAKEIVVADIDKAVKDIAGRDPGVACAVIRADKKSLNNINKAGGVGGAGDASLKLYMDILADAVKTTFPDAQKTYLVRDSDHSDEVFAVVLGKKENMERGAGNFAKMYEDSCARSIEKLADYGYSLNKLMISEGSVSVIPVELDLGRFADALVEPGLVAGAHISGPVLIERFEEGFLKNALAVLGKKEAVDFGKLPPEFSPLLADSGISPFVYRSEETGFLDPDCVALEIKFAHCSKKARYAPFGMLDETQKGLSELLSGRFGLRYINTYMGEAVADGILNNVGLAMEEIERVHGLKISKSSSKLTFIIKGADPQALEALAKKEIEKRLSGTGFSAHPVAIHAGSTHANDLRAYLTLHNMNLPHLPSEAATYADLLVSVAKIMRPQVVAGIINNGAHPGFNQEAGSVFSCIYELCSKNPAIRDSEDLIWLIRSGSLIGPDAENGIWSFVLRWGKEFRNRLIDVLKEEKNNGRK